MKTEQVKCPSCKGDGKVLDIGNGFLFPNQVECPECKGIGTVEGVDNRADNWLKEANEELKKHTNTPFGESVRIEFFNLNDDILSNHT